MALQLYRRHTKACSKARGIPHEVGEWDKTYRRCRCPIMVEGADPHGQFIRRSTKKTTWDDAEKVKLQLERPEVTVVQATTLDHALNTFQIHLTTQHLAKETIRKYVGLFDSLRKFCTAKGYLYLKQLDIPTCREFRATWPDRPFATAKKIARLRTFFKFCLENRWIEINPALLLAIPQAATPQTMPFTDVEWERMLLAADSRNYSVRKPTRDRMKALLMMLRYTGLRIGDAYQLTTRRVTDGKLFLYTAKTGTPVWLPLHPDALAALAVLKPVNDYYFWDRQSEQTDIAIAGGNARRSLNKLFEVARIPNGHAHRFRDTFAVNLLQAGVPMEVVSMLLGHSSIKVTEKHYSPWVKGRQDKLEEAVRSSWG